MSAEQPSYETLARRVQELEAVLQALRTEHALLQESETRFRRITAALTDYIFTVRVENGAARETIHAAACREVTGYTAEEFQADPYLWIRMVPEEDRHIVREQIARILSRQDPDPIEHRIMRKDGLLRWVRNTPVLHYAPDGALISYEGLIRDITEIREAQGRREELVHELQEALSRVKQLSGLLPICAACKKIRNDQGYWQQIEAFIHEHSEAEFSHGICPDCFQRLYPDLAKAREPNEPR